MRRASVKKLLGTADLTSKPVGKAILEAKAIAVSYSPKGVLADASKIIGLPRDNFEIHEISEEEFEGLRSK